MTPRGGPEASSTAFGDVCFSRYFWTTIPPIEWPTTTGGVSKVAATSATSST